MLERLRDLVAHKGHANAAILSVVGEYEAAAADRELNALLHHVLLANRFWMLAILGLPCAAEDESRPSRSFDELVQRFSSTQEQESRWLAAASEADLTRVLRDPLIPGGQCSVAEALLQVCMHSHGHAPRSRSGFGSTAPCRQRRTSSTGSPVDPRRLGLCPSRHREPDAREPSACLSDQAVAEIVQCCEPIVHLGRDVSNLRLDHPIREPFLGQRRDGGVPAIVEAHVAQPRGRAHRAPRGAPGRHASCWIDAFRTAVPGSSRLASRQSVVPSGSVAMPVPNHGEPIPLSSLPESHALRLLAGLAPLHHRG